MGFFVNFHSCVAILYFFLLSSLPRTEAELTFTSVPIDALIRQHFLIDDGSVSIRNVTTSSDDYQTSHSHICYALFEKEESSAASTISNTDDVEPVPERGIVLGTGGAIFGVNGTTTATDEAEVDARQEYTGEVDSKYWDIDILDQHLSSSSSSSSSSSAHRSNDEQVGQYNICRIRFEFKCSIINDNDDENDNNSSRKQLDFGYVFASQEYMDDNRGYDAMTSYAHGNDAFTVLLNGENIAMIPVLTKQGNNGGVSKSGVSLPVSVDSINTKTNSEYYISYKLDGQIVSANGFTVELHPYYYNDNNNNDSAATAKTTLLLDEWNVIEFTISDVGDDNINSWAFLSANSFSCRKVMEDVTEGGQTVVVDGDDDQERNTTSSVRIPLLMALTIAGLLGIIGLALPVLCLTFYNKRLPSDERFFGWLMKGW